jgi:rhodanese-related sulfurtransferase
MSTPTRRFHLPSAVRRMPVRIEPDEARRLAVEGATVIDVRRRDEDRAEIPGALRISPDEIPAHLADLPRDRPIVLGCT